MYKTSICRWPKDDRPRERLAKYGEHQLSDAELLAILIRTGVKGSSAIDLARGIMDQFKTFRNMGHTDTRDWLKLKGVGPAKLAQIKAALEIGRRFREQESHEEKIKITTAKDAAAMMSPRLRDLKVEVFKVIYLNGQNHIIGIDEAAQGTVNFAAPIIREILNRGLQMFATSMICVHNHPSGEALPSQEDRRFTRKLFEAASLLQIKLLDHIIVGNDVYYSFSEQGLLSQARDWEN